MATSANGVYVELHSKGNMTVTIKLPRKTIGPIETTVAKEVLALSDCTFMGFKKVISRCRNHCFSEVAPLYGMDPSKYGEPKESVTDVFNRMIRNLSMTDPIMAALISMTVQNRMPKNDGSVEWQFQRDNVIAECVHEPLDLHFSCFLLLYESLQMRDAPISYIYRVEQKYDLEKNRTVYVFYSTTDYYNFLMMQFALLQPKLTFCCYCGKPFIPKTRKATKYCDRPQWDGKTCKQVAPAALHKDFAESNVVIRAFDATKQKLYRRYERTRDCVITDKMLDYEDYCEWNEKATAARDAYLRGELSAEDALAVIKSMD